MQPLSAHSSIKR